MPQSVALARAPAAAPAALAAGSGVAALAQPGALASAPAPRAVPQPALLRQPSPPATRAPAPGPAPPARSTPACAAPDALLRPAEQLPPASPVFSKPLSCHFRQSLCVAAPSPRAWMDMSPESLDLLHPELPPLSDLLFLDDEMWEEGASVLPGVPVRDCAHGGGAAHAPAGALEPVPGGAGGEESAAGAHAGGRVIRVCSHPLWPILVDYYFACRKVGATDSATIRAIHEERAELSQRVHEANAAAAHQPYVFGTDPELDSFLPAYVKELEGLKGELEQIHSTTEDICADFEKRLKAIMPSLNCAGAGGSLAPRSTTAPAGSALAACAVAQAQSGSLILAATGEVKLGGLGRDAEELLRQHLKRRHAASLLSLKEEFMRKRKKGRLPKDATEALKAWWQSNLVWPYPSDDDKRALGDDTGLNATQINNWFINQRKRHWHKLFVDGPPASAEEAHRGLLRAYGSLEAVQAAAQRA